MPRSALKLADHTTRKPTTYINFTKKNIEALDPPTTGRRYVYDHRQAGLALAITATGHRSYYLYRKGSNGRPVRLKIGNYDDISIDQARTRARELTGDVARGVDLAAARRQKRQRQAELRTFKGVWEHYRDHHLKVNCSAATIQNDKYLFEAVTFKNRKLDTITPTEIKGLHEKLSKRGEVWANRVIQFIRRLFNYAIDELGYIGDNPVRVRQGRRRKRRSGREGVAVSLASERSRDRYLKPDEAPRFFEALDAEHDNDFKHLIYLLIYTGARRSNVQSMKWADVDLDNGVWSIPADEAKAGRDIHIPLIRRAVAILRLRRKWNNRRDDPSGFVFPAKRGKSGHMMEPKKQWWELRKRAGVPDLFMHDLRRSLATWQRTAGTNLETIGASLGHGSIAATEVYARVDLAPVRNSITSATDAMLKAPKAAKRKGAK